MNVERLKFLEKQIAGQRFESVEDLQEFLQRKALRQKASGRWISLVAILVGVTYLAFQELVTILAISLFIIIGIYLLLRRETREVAAMMLDRREAEELFRHLQHDEPTE